MFEIIGNRLIIDFNNCKYKNKKIKVMQDIINKNIPTHKAKEVEDGIYEIKFHFKDMPEFMRETLIKAFEKYDKKRNSPTPIIRARLNNNNFFTTKYSLA